MSEPLNMTHQTYVEEIEAVEESILHLDCITAFILITVFEKCPSSSFTITAFKELPVSTYQLVFEDPPQSPEQPKHPGKSTACADKITVINPCLPQPDFKAALPKRADLRKHQETCKALLNSKTLDVDKIAVCIAQMMQYIDKAATKCPMILYDNAVEETGSHIAHKVTTLSCKAMPSTMYACRPINAVFKTPPVLAPELVLENTSSLQSAGSQEQLTDLETCVNPRVAQPEVKVQLTLADLDSHHEAWKSVQKFHTRDADKMAECMLQTLQKVEHLVTQTEFYEKENKTRQDNERIKEMNEQQLQLLNKMYPGVSKM